MRYADDYKIGDIFDLGTYAVTDEEIIAFASRYDPQPYHVSANEGEASFFKGLVASGWHTSAMWMRLYVEAILPGAHVEGSPGVDELRWNSPVRPGDVLHGWCEVVDLKPNPFRQNIVVVRKKGTLARVGELQPVLSLILNSRFFRRPSTSAA
jgi:acyl dehydratase